MPEYGLRHIPQEDICVYSSSCPRSITISEPFHVDSSSHLGLLFFFLAKKTALIFLRYSQKSLGFCLLGKKRYFASFLERFLLNIEL